MPLPNESGNPLVFHSGDGSRIRTDDLLITEQPLQFANIYHRISSN